MSRTRTQFSLALTGRLHLLESTAGEMNGLPLLKH
jgi:hypothetical protein